MNLPNFFVYINSAQGPLHPYIPNYTHLYYFYVHGVAQFSRKFPAEKLLQAAHDSSDLSSSHEF